MILLNATLVHFSNKIINLVLHVHKDALAVIIVIVVKYVDHNLFMM
jgi:hypothetical protein